MAVTQVRTEQIRDSAITIIKIADSAVVTKKIADSNITTAKVADSAVTTAKVADSNITTEKVADSAITTAKVADSNVITAKIADSNVTTGKVADSAITTAKIANSNVTTVKIADSNVTSKKLADSSVITKKIADSNVTTRKLADSAVTTKKIADGAVDSSKIKDSTITLSGLIVTGNAILQGSTTFIQSTNVVMTDPLILLGSGAIGSGATANESGVEIDRGDSNNSKIYWNETNDRWEVYDGTNTYPVVDTQNFTDNEVKTFVATTVSWQLAATPNPAGSLKLYFNGQRWQEGAGNDFQLSNSTVTLLAVSATSSDVVISDYRI